MSEILSSPNLGDGMSIIKRGLNRRETIIIVGSCSANYKGRAESSLLKGGSIIILKPDGSLLVHRKFKREPVNWQPPGCKARASINNGKLRIISSREEPREMIEINFDDLSLISSFDLLDDEELELIGSEAEMVDSVFKNPELVESGFKPLSKEKKTRFGNIDLYGLDSEGRHVVMEFKRRRAGPESVSQLDRYVSEIKGSLSGKVREILVAPGITGSASQLLSELDLEFMRLKSSDQGFDLKPKKFEKRSLRISALNANGITRLRTASLLTPWKLRK